jgi:hypothetical protein
MVVTLQVLPAIRHHQFIVKSRGNEMVGKHSNLIRFLSTLAVLLFLQTNSAAATDSESAAADLKNFRFQRVNREEPPCATFDCRLVWGAAAAALGDAGIYARRVGVAGMADYAKSIGVEQNFLALKQLVVLPPVLPYHISKSFQIKIKNIAEIKAIGRDEASWAVEGRPIIETKINDIPLDVIFDSGAQLSIPIGSAPAKSLDVLPIESSSTSATGSTQTFSFSTAGKVKVGDAEIFNLKANLGPQILVGSRPNEPIGLIGSDLMFRFDAVTMDLVNGLIEFNPEKINSRNCAPMELVLDKHKMLAGIVVDVTLDGAVRKARMDTGANVEVLLHGKHMLANKEFHATEVRLVDMNGRLEMLEYTKADFTLGSHTSSQNFLRTTATHPDFDITLGAKFFINKIVTYDFLRHQFCMN